MNEFIKNDKIIYEDFTDFSEAFEVTIWINKFIIPNIKYQDFRISMDNSALDLPDSIQHIKLPIQQHTNHIVDLTEREENIFPDTDGLYTKQSHLLGIFTADCIPIFYISKNQGYGIVHAGWKGILNKIPYSMLTYFKNKEDLYIILGPSISSKFFIVQEDVFSMFQENSFFSKNYYYASGNGFHIDLKMILKDQFLAQGILSQNIFSSKFCTYENYPQLPSHRQSHLSGRMLATIQKKIGHFQ